MDFDRDPALALRYRCSHCDAVPGENCRDETRGAVLELPHYGRTPERIECGCTGTVFHVYTEDGTITIRCANPECGLVVDTANGTNRQTEQG